MREQRAFPKPRFKLWAKYLSVSHANHAYPPTPPKGWLGWFGQSKARAELLIPSPPASPRPPWVQGLQALERGVMERGRRGGRQGFRHFLGASGDLRISYVKFSLFAMRPLFFAYFWRD